jgi:hypothetical protein
MSLLDAAWHGAAFFVTSLGLGAIGALSAKALWRRELKVRSWWRLAAWSSAGAALAAVCGLLVFGQDGRMLTYGAMVAAAAASLSWFLWPRR